MTYTVKDQLNYHHLRYFYAIAKEGNLTRAAEKLTVSQSALSAQLKKLEESLNEPLFQRQNKRLILTEAGKIALDYAETIFSAGNELVSILQEGTSRRLQALKIGVVATLSRNFQLDFVAPLIDQPGVEIIIRSSSLREHLRGLRNHTLDVILANRSVPVDSENKWHSHLLDEQEVSIVAAPRHAAETLNYPNDLKDLPLIVPTTESNVRHAFDQQMQEAGILPRIVAEIDDMAMLRLMARESDAHTLVPPVVVKDELDSGELIERHCFPEIRESFFAITPDRRFPNELVRILVKTMTDRGIGNSKQ